MPGDRKTHGIARVHTNGWILESAAFFAVGCAVMAFICPSPNDARHGEAGVAGHDSYYHIKMAAMLPEYGLVKEFPWLKFVYFMPEGHGFVDHHYGFHALLLPFVSLSRWLTGDIIPGGRWAVVTFFGVTLVMYNLVLRSLGVRWRWLWLLFFLLMPFQFFNRHAYVRAIGPSLIFMLAMLPAMFHRRCALLGILIAAYVHLYLGAVLYAPLLVILYVVASAIGPREERAIPWKLIAWSVGGWSVGILTHPYAGGILDFLRLQVFGSGLTPDISVGREWKSYQGVWWFAQMSGNVLLFWMIALCARLRMGPRLNAQEMFLLLANFAFLLLTAKARRFIEYWPIFCLLSTAALAAPLMGSLAAWLDRFLEPSRSFGERALRRTVIVAAVVCLAVLVVIASHKHAIAGFTNDWSAWTALCAFCLLGPLTHVWLVGSGGERVGVRIARSAAVLLWGLLFVAAAMTIAWLGFAGFGTQSQRFEWTAAHWLVLGGVYIGVAIMASRLLGSGAGISTLTRCIGALAVVVTGLALLLATTCFASDSLLEVQRIARRPFDLTAVRKAMNFLKDVSRPGDVVFTDDWDIFPVYFCYNARNHYIVGLDPKFTQARRPVLWERYVKISRGQVPADISVSLTDETGHAAKKKIHVALEDIREHFGASFVITDHDHKPLARKLANASDFAELIYPGPSYASASDAPYLIFRIRE